MTKRNILPALVALVAVVGLLFFLPSREKASVATYQHNEGTIFGTIYHAKYLCDEDLCAEIEAALQKVDASLSMFNPKSTISRINRNETSQADEMLCEVLQLSYRVNAATANRSTAFALWWGSRPYIFRGTASRRTSPSPSSTSARLPKATVWTRLRRCFAVTA